MRVTILDEAWYAARQAAIQGTTVLVAAVIVFVFGFGAILAILGFVDPPTSAVMLRDRLSGTNIQYRWTPLKRISPNLIRSVISSEDARFCSHSGIDWHELAIAFEEAERDGLDSSRGASTITMQVAKNLFLWTGRSVVRKAFEFAMAPMIEVMWPKQRIIEVYLNIAQWGPGVFGADAAARYHFKRPPHDLTERQASLLTAALPAPSKRKAGNATRQTQRIARRIEQRMRPGRVQSGCVLPSDDKGN